MIAPEIRGEESRSRRRGSLLGVVAYVLLPGERRRRAAGHFQRAGVEVLRGMGELGRLERREADGPTRRERIEIE
jgi:hypothetical protein